MSKIIVSVKGGKGSGFRGHGGRPGKVGGSSAMRNEEMLSSGHVRAFHGTSSEFIDSITKNGIVKSSGDKRGYGQGRPDSVYFSTDITSALTYAESESLDPLSDVRPVVRKHVPAIIRFLIPQDAIDQVIADEVDNIDYGDSSAYRIERNIPPSWIDSIIIYESDIDHPMRIPFVEGKPKTWHDLSEYIKEENMYGYVSYTLIGDNDV